MAPRLALALLTWLALFALATALLATILSAVGVPEFFRFPRSIADVRKLAVAFDVLLVEAPYRALACFVSVYLWKQTFSIPGSTLLNLLAGAAFGTSHAFALITALTGFGATLCYLLAKRVGGPFVTAYGGERFRAFRDEGTLVAWFATMRRAWSVCVCAVVLRGQGGGGWH